MECWDNDGVTVHDGTCTAGTCTAGVTFSEPCATNIDCATWHCDFTP